MDLVFLVCKNFFKQLMMLSIFNEALVYINNILSLMQGVVFASFLFSMYSATQIQKNTNI